jgi:hypothetical protein
MLDLPLTFIHYTHLRSTLNALAPYALVFTCWALGLLGVALLAMLLRTLRAFIGQVLQRLTAVEGGLAQLDRRLTQAEDSRRSTDRRLAAGLGAIHDQVLSLGHPKPQPEAPAAPATASHASPMRAEERAAILLIAENVASRARQRELPAPTADLAAAGLAMEALLHAELPELSALRDRWPGRSDRLLLDAQGAVQDGGLIAVTQALQQLLRTVDLPVIGEKEAARMVVSAVTACATEVDSGGDRALQQLLAAWKIRAFSPRVGEEFDPAKHRPVGSLKGTHYDHRQIVRVERPGYQIIGGGVIELAWVTVGG